MFDETSSSFPTRVHAFKVIKIRNKRSIVKIIWHLVEIRAPKQLIETPSRRSTRNWHGTVRSPEVSIAAHVSDKIDSILELLSAGNVTAGARSIHYARVIDACKQPYVHCLNDADLFSRGNSLHVHVLSRWKKEITFVFLDNSPFWGFPPVWADRTWTANAVGCRILLRRPFSRVWLFRSEVEPRPRPCPQNNIRSGCNRNEENRLSDAESNR